MYGKFPIEDGVYLAGNLSPVYNRLEIDTVTVKGTDVYVEDEPRPFIFHDFDYWSEKLSK